MQLLEDVSLNEKTWNHTGDQKMAKLLKMIKKTIIQKIFEDFVNHKNKTSRIVVLVAAVF